MHEQNREHKKHINNKSTFLLLQNINNLQAQIKTLIDTSKQNYFSRISEKLESMSINTKSQGHDNVSIRMLKICGVSICKLFEIVFRTCLNHGKFLEE